MKKLIPFLLIIFTSMMLMGHNTWNEGRTFYYIFNAPSIAYQQGDSLLYVYLTASDDVVYYINGIPLDMTITDIVLYVNGDASSDIDSVKLITNLYGAEVQQYEWVTGAACTGSNQAVTITGINTSMASSATYPYLLRVYYKVNTSIKTFAIKITCTED